MANNDWNVDADGDWSNASDWSLGRTPDSTDSVTIDTADFHTVTFSSGDASINALTVGNDDFAMTGGSLQIANGANFTNDLALSGGTILQLSKGTPTTPSNFVHGAMSVQTAQIEGNGSGSGSLQVYGGLHVTGTLALTGALSTTFLGTSSISGEVDIDGGSRFGISGTLTVNGGSNILLGANSLGTAVGGGTFANGGTVIFDTSAGDIGVSGTGANILFSNHILTKTGLGTLTIDVPRLSLGTVTVESGTLSATGALQGFNLFTVDSGATFMLDTSLSTNALSFLTQGNGIADLTGGSGNDTFNFGDNFTAADHIDGGAGNDTLVLSGFSYASPPLVLSASAITNVETLVLRVPDEEDDTSPAYNVITTGNLVAAGGVLHVNAIDTRTFDFDGSAETVGSFAIQGSMHKNIIWTGQGNDTVDTYGGDDVIHAGTGTYVINSSAGNDIIDFTHGRLKAADVIDGFNGNDIIELSGDYAGANALVMTATTMVHIDELTLGAGYSYDITTANPNVSPDKSLIVDASALTSAYTLTFDGSVETTGNFIVTGGNGTDVIHTGAGNDVIDGGNSADKIYAGTGTDTVDGGSGADLISFSGGQLTAIDKIDGGTGSDEVFLNSNYTAGKALTMNATTMVNVELLKVGAGHSYNVTMNDANVGAGKTLTVDATQLTSAYTLTFDGSAETNGKFIVTGGNGTDVIHTGAGNDVINSGNSADKIYAGTGTDTIDGGSGADLISFSGGQLTAGDKIDGGTGSNEVFLNSDYTGANALTMIATTMVNVGLLKAGAGHSYNVTTNDANVGAGKTLTVDATQLTSAYKLTFNGSAETNGHFTIEGGLGGDVLTGGSQSDKFVYATAAQSSSTHYDTINAFNFASDKFDVTDTISKIDTGVNHAISTASFDTDIAAAASASHLLGDSAMLVTATSGTLAGHVFLVVDQNGTAGYQAGADLVIDMHSASGTLATGDFI